MTAKVRTDEDTSIDEYIGKRIHLRRKLVHMSQERLADAIGVTFQQVQKYENGLNRVSGSRLVKVARALDCPPAFFFEGLEDLPSALDPSDPLKSTNVLEAARLFHDLEESHKGTLLNLLRALTSARATKAVAFAA